ncbi:uncharacterized protein V1510DRAFT_422431 [Dipodascopsis tothii]|uniref:uncharacterized protein n=1 Tax=Dipodascopsis tothii TaxID=44089 RepID=UPI0034D012C2
MQLTPSFVRELFFPQAVARETERAWQSQPYAQTIFPAPHAIDVSGYSGHRELRRDDHRGPDPGQDYYAGRRRDHEDARARDPAPDRSLLHPDDAYFVGRGRQQHWPTSSPARDVVQPQADLHRTPSDRHTHHRGSYAHIGGLPASYIDPRADPHPFRVLVDRDGSTAASERMSHALRSVMGAHKYSTKADLAPLLQNICRHAHFHGDNVLLVRESRRVSVRFLGHQARLSGQLALTIDERIYTYKYWLMSSQHGYHVELNTSSPLDVAFSGRVLSTPLGERSMKLQFLSSVA